MSVSQACNKLYNDFTTLDSNLVKVKQKQYSVTMAYDSNIGKYTGSVSIVNDNPSGTLLAVLVTDNCAEGYGTLVAEWGIFDK